ncbi:MAG: dipeptidyl-peptidase 3 family protein, partial [Vicinamibacterales bacterium]
AGAVTVGTDGTFSVVAEKIKDAVKNLTGDIMTMQAEGNYGKASDLLKRLGVVRPPVQRVLDRLQSVPVDIEPVFVTAEQLR